MRSWCSAKMLVKRGLNYLCFAKKIGFSFPVFILRWCTCSMPIKKSRSWQVSSFPGSVDHVSSIMHFATTFCEPSDIRFFLFISIFDAFVAVSDLRLTFLALVQIKIYFIILIVYTNRVRYASFYHAIHFTST